MSFSANPLGQGARLDRTSFMNNNQSRPDSPPEDTVSTSPSRRGVVPLSYAYGAPTLKNSANQTSPKRVPSPSRSSSSTLRNHSGRAAAQNPPVNDEDLESNISYASSSARGQEPGAVRYARLKQRNQALGHTYHPSGPGIILSPPDGINLRDTSVNVATAFHQAAHNAMPPVSDHEKDAHFNASGNPPQRRIAAPPSKSRKPPSTTSSTLKLPEEIAERNGRSRSPTLDAVLSVGQAISRAATSPTSYLLREGDVGDDDTYQPLRVDESDLPSRQPTKDSAVPSNESYDYEAEEKFIRGEFSASALSQAPGHQKKKSASMSAAARLSLDNKAYRPPSDEEDDEEYEEGDSRRRRKGKKKDDGKGMTLPTIGYTKRKKKKSISKKGDISGGEEQSASGDELALPLVEPREARKAGSRPPSRPPSRAGSIPRESVPPSHPAHFQQPPLENVPETEEESSFLDQSEGHKGEPAPDLSSPSDADMRQMEAQAQEQTQAQTQRFSLGALLGKVVNIFVMSILRFMVQAIAMIFFLAWTVIRGIWVALIATPFRWGKATLQDLPWGSLSRVVFFATAVLIAGAAFRPAFLPETLLTQWWPDRITLPTYSAPALPAESVQDLIARLTQVEKTLADLAAKEAQAHHAAQRAQNDATSRVELLHGRIETETQRARDAEEQFRVAAAQGLAGVRSDFEKLQAEWDHVRKDDTLGTDVVQTLRELQERVSGVEHGVKEAVEAGQSGVKTGVSPGWWNKWGSGEGRLTIKSSDGQDVTALIDSLVDMAVSRFAKDITGKPDFALYSAGGRVIPSLTTNTYEIRPRTWRRYIVGAVTGSGYAVGRPPVTALHPDINVGNCWPFAGGHGQIGILLARAVLISEVTIDHAPREVAYDIRAAPRQMELWGLAEGVDNIAKVRGYQQSMRERRAEAVRRATEQGVPPPPEEDPYPPGLPRSPHYIRLAQFTYDVHAPQYVQTFGVPKDIQDIGADFSVAVLLIKNNWGEEDYTCLYRVRIHGTDKDRRPYLLPEQDAP